MRKFMVALVVAGAALAPGLAQARSTFIVRGSGGIAASETDGTFAFKLTGSMLRYGNATTHRLGTATIPIGCYPSAASRGAVLIQCTSSNPSSGAESGSAPLILSTHTGSIAPAPGAQFRSDATYNAIGAHWISGEFRRNGAAGTTFINRQTGQIASDQPTNARFDLDTPGTPTPIQLPAGRPGTRPVASAGPYALAYTSGPSTVRLELDRRARRVTTLSTCSPDCSSPSISTTTAAWAAANRVLTYSLKRKRTQTTRFPHAVRVLRVVAQPHQTLAAVLERSGRVAMYSIR